ncbi:MAG: UDP-N-acetylglucosamine 1-carboxyvinyltransferase, partial [Alphaproteobacteria bacterium]|nr:UDP-N-acetylglucosamine 1-carboxyvinyltransferase [Alphaproteobacteria bacterium]
MLQSMRIIGGNPLNGEVAISGAKNLALPALVASILTDEALLLTNVPNLADITSLLELLEHIGVDISRKSAHSLELMTCTVHSTEAPYDFVRKMRASILVLGALIGRCREATVSLPGGCAIGARGVDLHIRALELMGADVSI